MTKQQTALAARLVAHPRWQWVAGMLAGQDGFRVVDDAGKNVDDVIPLWAMATSARLPRLDDFATAAILLRMAMEDGEAFVSAHTAHLEDDVWRLYNEQLPRTWPEGRDLGTVAATALLACWGE